MKAIKVKVIRMASAITVNSAKTVSGLNKFRNLHIFGTVFESRARLEYEHLIFCRALLSDLIRTQDKLTEEIIKF